MRPILLIVAAVAAFFVWDRLANDGRLLAGIESSWTQATDFASGNGIQITLHDFTER
ncbi:hypothetical protein [Mesorhizobium sp. WSM3859]|uniref:hypothetical protein n=1 Tax=Mesorhizobium sp. WSM3859 TaxID=2029402 RepID=UPI001596ADB0|nr:hypothetical protein [Mesorhizobium sp. WSM3859]